MDRSDNDGLDVDGGTRAASLFNGPSGVHGRVPLDGIKTTQTASSQVFIKLILIFTMASTQWKDVKPQTAQHLPLCVYQTMRTGESQRVEMTLTLWNLTPDYLQSVQQVLPRPFKILVV